MKGAVQESARSFLLELCRTHSYECHALEIMEDHIHLFISFGPRRSVADVVKDLKGSSARYLFLTHPEIKRFLWGGHLWNPSYYVGTAGSVSKEAIQAYIEEQKTS